MVRYRYEAVGGRTEKPDRQRAAGNNERARTASKTCVREHSAEEQSQRQECTDDLGDDHGASFAVDGEPDSRRSGPEQAYSGSDVGDASRYGKSVLNVFNPDIRL